MLESEVHNLMFQNQQYFDSVDNCSLFTKEQLLEILKHLINLEEKYFQRVMKLRNDKYEKEDKEKGRLVMCNAIRKINEYLDNLDFEQEKIQTNHNYNFIYIFIIIIIMTLYLMG